MSLTVIKTVTPIKVTGTTAADTEILGRSAYIKFVYWYNPATLGDLFALKDKSGQDILVGRCESNNESQWMPVYTKFNGIHCDDMDSGTLYIYIA